MRPCIECGVPTDGSIGAAGIRWTGLCQSCKDQADQQLQRSIATYAAAADFMMPRMLKSFSSAGAAELLIPDTVLDGRDYCGAVSDCTCGKIGCPSRQPDDGPHPSTCILTGAPGEDPDDCTTHEHENAGCDKCGIHDREPGSLWCSGCNEEWNRLQAEPAPTTPEAA